VKVKMAKGRFIFATAAPILIFVLSLSVAVSSGWTAKRSFWGDVGTAMDLGFYDLARQKLQEHKSSSQKEQERKWLALAYISYKRRDSEGLSFYLKKIPASSPYAEAAKAMSWDNRMEVEEVSRVFPEHSAVFQVFSKMLRKDSLAALDFLLLNSRYLISGELEKGVISVHEHFFWQGDDDRVVALLRRFPFLAFNAQALWRTALSHYRRGEYMEALSLLSVMPTTSKVHFWMAWILGLMGRNNEALVHTIAAARGKGFYALLGELLKDKLPTCSACCHSASKLSPLLVQLIEMGMGDVAERIIMDRLWTGNISTAQASSLLYYLSPNLALKLKGDASKMEPFCPYRSLVCRFCRLYQVELPLVYAIMRKESQFNKRSMSRSGAVGLMQVLPSTGREIAEALGESTFFPEKLYLPFFGIRYGVWYISWLQKRFSSIPLVVAAYNAGPTALRRWHDRWYMDTPHEVAEFYPKAATRRYVKQVIAYYLLYCAATRRVP